MSDVKAPMDPKQKTVLQLVGVVVFMGSLAWASVPLYDWFCRVTGWGGATDVAEAAMDEPLEETIKGFQGLVKGDYDHLPEQAFYMVGSIEEAVEKAKSL